MIVVLVSGCVNIQANKLGLYIQEYTVIFRVRDVSIFVNRHKYEYSFVYSLIPSTVNSISIYWFKKICSKHERK